MKKNVIWWPAIKNPKHYDKYGNYDYFEYSKLTWKYFCKRYNCEFVEFTDPYETDFIQYRPQWQKCLYVFDELNKRGIEYDQIALVDSTAMVKWDCPNFFELTDRKFCAWPDIDNLNWVYESIQGYKDFFNGFELDISKYFNSGFMIFNETHKWFFDKIKDMYFNNQKTLIYIQDTLRKGNDQTPINYLAQINNLDLNLSMPIAFNLRHINRKEMLGYNWQLNTDRTPFFIKYGYVYRTTGIPKDRRSQFMKSIWDITKHMYTEEMFLRQLIDYGQHKDTAKWTTSKKFKYDVVNYFNNHKNKTYLELGSCQGNSIQIYSYIFKHAIGIEFDYNNIEISKNTCKYCNNINFQYLDIAQNWNNLPDADIINLDAMHTYEGVRQMIDYSKIKYPNAEFIIDDYGHMGGTVKKAIDEYIDNNIIEVIQWIGENKGYIASNGKSFVDKEGLIFKFKL